MVFNNYIEFLVQHSLTSKLYIKFFLLLLFCYFLFIFFICILNIFDFLNKKLNQKKKLLIQENNLINLKKKFLDGKINAKEYKVSTIEILNNIK